MSGSILRFLFSSKKRKSVCPICGRWSKNRHSCYHRTLQHTPLSGHPVMFEFVLHKYYCKNPSCIRKIFAEPIAGLARYARNTLRLDEFITSLSLRLSSTESSSFLLQEGIICSPSSCVRRLKRLSFPEKQRHTAIGIDDFAWRKGHHYGSVQVDMLTRKPIDLLYSRDSRSVYSWFLTHPEVKYVSRDGSIAFKEAISNACPQAEQIRDRFHLVKDFSSYIEKLVLRLHRDMEWKKQETRPSKEDIHGVIWAHVVGMGNKVRREKIRRYQLFNELKSKGYSIREIARKTGMDSSNIRRHQEIRLDKLLTANQWSIIKHIEQISEGIAAGTMTGEQDIISHYKDVEGTDLIGLDQKLDECFKKRCVEQSKKRKLPKPSNKEIFKTFFCKGYKSAHPMLLEVLENNIVYRKLIILCREFRDMMNGYPFTHTLQMWIRLVRNLKIKECSDFCKMVELDFEAIANAVELPFNNGILEGTVNRIKNIKRMMFGKAGERLLKMKLILNSST